MLFVSLFLIVVFSSFFFFFFSSRRRHTRSLCDWSSDVCSSDLFGVIYLLADLDIISAPEGLESCEGLNGLTMERHQRKPQRFLPENPADRLRPLRTPEGRAAVDRTGPLPVGEGTVHTRPSRAHPNLDPCLSPDRTLEIRRLRTAAPLTAGEGPQSAQ